MGVERELKAKMNLCETTCLFELFLMCSCRSELCITGVYQAQRNRPLAGKQRVRTHAGKPMKLQRFFEDVWAKEATLSALGCEEIFRALVW